MAAATPPTVPSRADPFSMLSDPTPNMTPAPAPKMPAARLCKGSTRPGAGIAGDVCQPGDGGAILDQNSKRPSGALIRSINRPGGKTRLLPILLPLIAEKKHVCYAEPFAGSFTVGFNKPRSKTNVLNDADGELLNAFRQLQRHPSSLLEELEGMINSRAEMARLKASKGAGLTEIQRAAWFLWAVMISFGSDGQTFGVQKSSGGGGASRLSSLLEKVKTLRASLDGVIIEHVDWRRCLALYDSPDTLFFLDPPYSTVKANCYAAFAAADMDALRDALAGLKGAWILTVDDTPENRTRFGQWLRATKSTQSGSCNQANGPAQFREIICTSWKGGPSDAS